MVPTSFSAPYDILTFYDPSKDERTRHAIFFSRQSRTNILFLLQTNEIIFLAKLLSYVMDLDDPNIHVFAATGDVAGVRETLRHNITACGANSVIPLVDENMQPINEDFGYEILGKQILVGGLPIVEVKGMTPLHLAALFSFDSYAGNTNVNFGGTFDLLIQNNADVCAKNGVGNTPLHLLAGYGYDIELVKKILSKDLSALWMLDGSGNNVLQIAALKNNLAMFTHLLESIGGTGAEQVQFMINRNSSGLSVFQIIDEMPVTRSELFKGAIRMSQKARSIVKACVRLGHINDFDF
ncbi:MAG: ankyrin repeat domain-containing protein [Epsilonproteobacteria bacterium]|nr:ankyrin repeat domain-containing protein [Campylobacterota bacterium]